MVKIKTSKIIKKMIEKMNKIISIFSIKNIKKFFLLKNIFASFVIFSILFTGVLFPTNKAEALSATGGTITTNGGYTIHTFTSSGTLTFSGSGNVEVLVVAGGGGGGSQLSGGGGGAGGVIYNSSFAVASQAYTVTVGGGGGSNTNGSDSVFSSLTAVGGGAGGGGGPWDAGDAGSAGGSGGGASGEYMTTRAGGTGTAGQGNNGGSSAKYSYPSYNGGGGGGAGGAGSASTTNQGGNGGVGISNSISGSAVYYGGGGGGSIFTENSGSYPRGTGGNGGGGAGESRNSGGILNAAVAGTSNTGGGGGGSAQSTGASGGSGIVIVRYLTNSDVIPTVTTPTSASITDTTATLGANVTSLGVPASISARGTCWGTSPAPTTNCTAEGGTTTGVFTHSRTGLTAGTLYYYRGYATNTTGTAYSADGTFTTSAANVIPTVTTPTSASITDTTATLGANVTSLGVPASISARGTCWGTSPAPTTNCTAEGGTTTGVFTHSRTGLTAGTLYYYRGYATNTTGTAYSADGTFTTSAVPTTGSLTASDCTITAGNSSCNTNLVWSTTNPITYNPTSRVLVVGAGGGSGYSGYAGGAGAGGYVHNTNYNITSGSYSVTIGVGSAGSTGGNSIFNDITAYGGAVSAYSANGYDGGSGSGAGGGSDGVKYGGIGSQGNNGGGANGVGGGGGGGGAGGVGGYGNSGVGGVGLSNDITGTAIYYAGGGGAISQNGGLGGGGSGIGGSLNGTNGLGGGGGGGNGGASTGGSGVVIIRYATNSKTCTGGTITTVGADTVHTFTTSGTFNCSGVLSVVKTPTDITVATANSSAGTAYSVAYGTRDFTLSHNGVTLDTKTATASCDAVSSWNGSVCISPPTVTTPTSSSIANTTATLGANVTSLGSPASISARGVKYGLTSGSRTYTAVASGTTTGVYTVGVTGLTAGTLYYYEGYATNTTGTAYSAEGTFTTAPNPTGSLTASNCTITAGNSSCNTNLTWNTTNPLPLVSVQALVVAGGGGGGGDFGGGGGGGGVVYNNSFSVSSGSYSVTVGGGGAGTILGTSGNTNGNNSSFSTITSIGGGKGSNGSGVFNTYGGAGNGGNGGGGGSYNVSANPKGIGNAGYDGGIGYGDGGNVNGTAGGGGGAGSAGVNGVSSKGGNGGTGISNSISGAATYYGGGGGGGAYSSSVIGTGGLGGGGNGATGTSQSGVSGTSNTGGGGGGNSGGGGGSGGNGGSGVVIVRYPTANATCTGGTITTVGADTVHTFTSSGTFSCSSASLFSVVTTPTAITVATSNSSAGTAYSVAYGTRDFTLSHNGVTLDTKTATASCDSTTSIWNGTICQQKVVPTITTPTSASIANTTATLGANVTSLGWPDSISARGVVYGTTTAPTGNATVASGTTTGVYTVGVTGLSICTLYYYRGYATNATGTAYSSESTFTTTGCVAPTLTTPTSSVTGSTTATLGANVTSLGLPASISARGVVYGTTTAPTGNTTVASGTTTGVYTVGVTGLSACTLYYYRGYATNTTGTAYSTEGTFTTTGCTSPTVTTPTSASITDTTATLGANVTSLGLPASISARGVKYGLTSGSRTTTAVASGTTTGVYTVGVTGLSICTLYYYEGYATNTTGTAYSTEGTFTTTGCTSPTVTTPTSASITDTTATLGANVTSLGGPASISSRGICYNTSANPSLLNGANCVGFSDSSSLLIKALVVGGGGGGGLNGTSAGNNGGPGGGGGLIEIPNYTMTPGSYPITIGSGGNGASSWAQRGYSGGNSTFNGMTAIGGGGGGNAYALASKGGVSGGSGGGAAVYGTTYSSGGSSTQTTSNGGYPGTGFGYGAATSSSLINPSGGGGAGGASTSSTGGQGRVVSGTTYGAGGSALNDISGGSNTGNGGGTSSSRGGYGLQGGSGVVVIRYTTADYTGWTITGGTITTDGAETVHTFTSNGTLTVTLSFTTGVYTNNITGLNACTPYYFRGYATNATGTAYSTEGTFTTTGCTPPTVTTPTSESITSTTATLGASVATLGTPASISSRGIYYGTSPSPTTFQSVASGTTTGAYTINATGLIPNTLYYYRGYAVNVAGTGYSIDGTFSTLPINAPTITTNAVSAITMISATANGSIDNDGNQLNDKRGFVYDTITHALPGNVTPASSLYLSSTTEQTGSFGVSAFSGAMTNLAEATTYYVRAYSHNPTAGYSYGNEVSFMTISFPVIDQSGYKIYNNVDFSDVGGALGSLNTPSILANSGDSFRLRLLLHVADTDLPVNGANFKLQYSEMFGDCDSGFVGENYFDVDYTSPIAFNLGNFYLNDKSHITASAAGDPTNPISTAIIPQTYVKSNPFTNSKTPVSIGEDAEWDFALMDKSDSSSQKSYCLRVIRADNGATLGSYSTIPQVIVARKIPRSSGSVNVESVGGGTGVGDDTGDQGDGGGELPTQCNDGVSNGDNDILVDIADPECHAGGLIENDYVSTHDSELTAPGGSTGGGGQGGGGEPIITYFWNRINSVFRLSPLRNILLAMAFNTF